MRFDFSDRSTWTVADLLTMGTETDGSHHKQWFLEEIASLLGIALPDHEPGIAP